MSYQPYEYQVSCLNTLARVRRNDEHHALVVMASGLGKTLTAAFDARRYLSRHPGKILYLCHQNDILEQAETSFKAVLPLRTKYGYYNGQQKDRNVDCLFATFQTMQEQCEEFDPKEFAYVVVDESHHGPAPTYRPTIDYFKPNFLLALTATPDRTDLQDIREIYGHEVYSLPLEDALGEGLLTRVDYRLMTDEIQNLKFLDTPVGKISIAELNRKLFVPKRDKEIARIIEERIAEVEDARVMIFCPSIAYCDRLVKYMPKAVAVHSELPTSIQNKRLDAFRSGEDNIVLTVDKFNEGIDVPEANVIVFLRSTASRTIFFQQLGRGLRKVRGKKNVLVLDFVGNCERLEMAHKLWQLVQSKYEGIASKQAGGLSGSPITVNYGKITFTEEIKKVLDVIAGIRTGYTREVLVKQLHDLARSLGKTPSHRDVFRGSKKGQCAAPQTFVTMFGTFNSALKTAGFIPNVERKSKEEMIQELKALAEELGRTPTMVDVHEASKAGKTVSYGTYRAYFGTWNRALKAAKIKVHSNRDFTRGGLITYLQNLGEKLGRTPKCIDLKAARKAGKFPAEMAFRKGFGSFNNALADAGFQINVKTTPRYTKDDLIDQLQAIAKEMGRRPTAREINTGSKAGMCVSVGKFQATFGSYAKALKAAKL
ncbi:MAG: DEAD/DEAH box helicase family protein [bacterium]|nr:DEAD/DEAH box helicase family protein [bacterium]